MRGGPIWFHKKGWSIWFHKRGWSRERWSHKGGPMRGGPIWFHKRVGPMRSGPIRGVGPIRGGTIKGGPRRYEGRNFLKAMASRDQVLKCTATISLKTHSKAPPLSAQYMSAKTLLPCSHNINLT